MDRDTMIEFMRTNAPLNTDALVNKIHEEYHYTEKMMVLNGQTFPKGESTKLKTICALAQVLQVDSDELVFWVQQIPDVQKPDISSLNFPGGDPLSKKDLSEKDSVQEIESQMAVA